MSTRTIPNCGEEKKSFQSNELFLCIICKRGEGETNLPDQIVTIATERDCITVLMGTTVPSNGRGTKDDNHKNENVKLHRNFDLKDREEYQKRK